jgi:hypothetical protein
MVRRRDRAISNQEAQRSSFADYALYCHWITRLSQQCWAAIVVVRVIHLPRFQLLPLPVIPQANMLALIVGDANGSYVGLAS